MRESSCPFREFCRRRSAVVPGAEGAATYPVTRMLGQARDMVGERERKTFDHFFCSQVQRGRNGGESSSCEAGQLSLREGKWNDCYAMVHWYVYAQAINYTPPPSKSKQTERRLPSTGSSSSIHPSRHRRRQHRVRPKLDVGEPLHQLGMYVAYVPRSSHQARPTRLLRQTQPGPVRDASD